MTLDPKAFKGLARFIAPSAGGTLADRALAENLIQPSDLEACLREQDSSGKSLDEILISKGLITQETAVRLRQSPLPPEAAAQVSDPTRVLNQYVLVSVLGSGGMSDVWKAWDRSICRWVAVKFLKGEVGRGTERIEREGRTAGALLHPNIVPIHDVGRHGGQPYLVMPLIQGKIPDPPLELREAVRITREIAAALQYVHEAGVLHRDVKPANILVEQGGRPLLCDFGLAISEARSAPGWTLSGTPQYASPEQLRSEPLDPRADVFSLGATLFHLVAGHPPFPGNTAEQIRANYERGELPSLRSVPSRLRPILRRAMDPDRQRRTASMAGFSGELEKIVVEGIGAKLRKPSVIAALALAAVLSSSATYFLVSMSRGASDRREATHSFREGQRYLLQAEHALAGDKPVSGPVKETLSKAVPEFFSALWLSGDRYPDASAGLGRCYELMGQQIRAEREYLKAGDHPDAHMGLARIGMRRFLEGWPGLDWKAWTLGHLSRVEAPSPSPTVELIRAYLQGKWNEGLQQGVRAMETEPVDDLAFLLLAGCARDAGRAEESLKWLERVRELRGENATLKYQQGLTYLSQGKKLEASKAFSRGMELASANWAYLPEIARQLKSLRP